MSWHRNRKTRILTVFIVLSSGATAAAADLLVVRSMGPSAKLFPAGKALSEKTAITLKANDMLVVLDGRGTRTLRGPGTFAPGAAEARTQTAAATPAPLRRARIGAVRGTEGETAARPPSLWHVDVGRSSNVCLADKADVTLWRAESAKPVTLTLTPSTGAPHQVAWPAGQATLAWPAKLPIVEGASYRLSWEGAAAPIQIRFKPLAAKPAGLEAMASSLIRNKCEAQLDLLIETVKLPEPEAPSR